MSVPRLRKRNSFGLKKMFAVMTILGIVAAIVVPCMSVPSGMSKAKIDRQNKAIIDSAINRWYVEKGAWPAINLSDISADINYFPSGLPTNPVDGSTYTLNATTHRVN